MIQGEEREGLDVLGAMMDISRQGILIVALQAMQVKVIVAGIECPGSYERILEDKDGVFLHVDCELTWDIAMSF